ncbi:capsule biosynthesis protein [Neisseria sp.]|uniref:capsule biosynthesis protein n=1 Tax=Neisseria sp. TaxID=192066 RepID=UPI00359FC528
MSKKVRKPGISFWLIVVLPTLLSVLYFGLVASDRYVSVSSFVIRSPQKSTSVTGLSAFLQNVGFSRSSDDSYIVHQYMLSRDAVAQLDKSMKIADKYGSGNVDFISRYNTFGFNGGLEGLYDYYQNKVLIDTDSTSSISTLTVKAYTAKDAHDINVRLLTLAEALINRLNARARQDMISFSEKEVEKAAANVNEISDQLREFRAQNKIFDVDQQSKLRLQLISKLQDQHILVQNQLSQLKAVTPENPQIPILEEKERNLRKDISKETNSALVGSSSLNDKAAGYERLILQKEVASKELAAALATLEQNKNEAQRKQLYLERVSNPMVPDDAIEPKRIKGILSTLVLSLVIWGILTLLTAGVKEHQG